MKYHLKIKPNGDLEFLGFPPPGLNLPVTNPMRFSEIVPDYIHPVRARAFRILRRIFGERGRVAAWTRQWQCMWVCVILQGPMRGKRSVSRSRKTLIEWEFRAWLNTPGSWKVTEDT